MITLSNWLESTGGALAGEAYVTDFTGFGYDSRIVEPGELFVAVVSETGDGHDHIHAAIRAGASGIVYSRPMAPIPGITCIQVADTRQALLGYARHMLGQPGRQIVGITGSVGKTSTKEALVAVLSRLVPTFGTYGNYNGRFGLPIALGRLWPEQEVAVLEIAADSLGEIAELAELTRPRIGVVTAIAHAHTSVFGTLDRIAHEKSQLVAALPDDGLALLNADDPRVRAMAGVTSAQVMTFGASPDADLRATDIRVTHQGTRFVCHWQGRAVPLSIPLIGAHHARTALAAVGAGLWMGMRWPEIQAGLADVVPQPGRTRLLPGINNARILDDAYNANPESALAALDTLALLPARRRIVLLGDMAELGDYAAAGHAEVGAKVAEVADLLVTKGDLATGAAVAARQAGLGPEQVHVLHSGTDAAALLSRELQEGDLLLVKGSATARLEQVTARLLADGVSARSVLARQNEGWRQVRLQQPGRPTWVDIDLEAIAGNVRTCKAIAGEDVEVMAILKADAYGHGAVRVARTALMHGATWLGVACLGEAIALRDRGIAAPILNLGYTPPWQAREAVRHDVTSVLYSVELAHALDRAGRDLGRRARAHIKVDTGMGRLGLLPDQVVAFADGLVGLEHLDVDGIMTHLSDADAADLDYTYGQLGRFDGVLTQLAERGHRYRYRHAANSAALLRLPETRLDMVRPGIALYGLAPSPDCPLHEGFRPALRFCCQVAQVKDIGTGGYVGYGRTFQAPRLTRIAVIPVGYADGFRRAPAHWGDVLVRGRRAPIVGRVCMDQAMLDVTDIPDVRAGDEVVLIGRQGDDAITVEDVARRLGTINYEVISAILARVPRMV